MLPEPFTIHVSDDELDFLKSRLRTARVIPNEVAAGEFDPNGAWSYGTDKSTLTEFIKYWLEQYDWRKEEANLNTFCHFKMPVFGLNMHFIHERCTKSDAIPLLLVHGWPGSIVEFLKVIPRLKDAGFHVVAPSIPGYGWSEAPKERGADCVFMAKHMNQLMIQLGYEQYFAQGGDWGSIITGHCAFHFPQNCVAYHTNMPVPIGLPRNIHTGLKLLFGLATMSSSEREGVMSTLYFAKHEDGYQRIQGTKPQSLGYGLNDSPTGLLAWILEKFQSWSDCGAASPEASGITKDEILTNVMVYWTTQTITSSCRIYYETLPHAPGKGFRLEAMPGYIAVPTGVLQANDLFRFPRVLATLSYNLQSYRTHSRGGHFFALEQPDAYLQDVVGFFRDVLDFEDCKRRAPRPGQGPPLEAGRLLTYAAMLGLLGFVAGRLRSRL